MAYARTGRADKAREIYIRADQSLREEHGSIDREPLRFREEAAAVLEVTSAVNSASVNESDPGAGKPSSEQGTPKTVR